jgi:ABC-type multidrug transport system fused ATPase/permease subunit
LLGYAFANIFSTGLRTKIEGLFTHNEGVLSSTFDVAVRKQLISARGRLDITTLADPIVSSAFRQASALQAVDVASHVVNIFTGAFSVWSQLSLYRMLSSHRRTISYKPVLGFAFAGSLIQYFRWFLMPQSAERTRSTHYAFQRLNELWAVSCQAEDTTKSADNKLLGLEEYLTRQFDLASDKLGELAFIRNKTKSLLQFSFELSSHAWPVLLRAFFAIRALRSPKSVESLSQLSITMLCARKIAHSVSSLVSTVDDLRLDCTKLKAFYQVLEVESLIKEPLVPLEYKAHTGLLGSGMKIEFKNVSFGYGGPDGPMALKNFNFTLLPGALVCVVGGNGAGKVKSPVNESYVEALS